MAAETGGLWAFIHSVDQALRPSNLGTIRLDNAVEWFVKDWLVPNFRPAFHAAEWPVNAVMHGLEAFLLAVPFVVIVGFFVVLGWRTAGRGVAIFALLSLSLLEMIGLWSETMTTLAMILTAVFFCAIVGIPVGILAAGSNRAAAIIRPVLDIMQTIPPFVYLVPIVMLFGVGMVPGVLATIIFALPPIIRLTNLGIRQVQEELVEAGYAFGSTRREVLFEIQIPLALRTIMAGLNQTLMLALSMAVIAALIGAGGLGLTVFTGLGRLDVGAAFQGGLGIVLLAIMLDRITQALGTPERRKNPDWTFTGLLSALWPGSRQRDQEPSQPAQPAEK